MADADAIYLASPWNGGHANAGTAPKIKAETLKTKDFDTHYQHTDNTQRQAPVRASRREKLIAECEWIKADL